MMANGKVVLDARRNDCIGNDIRDYHFSARFQDPEYFPVGLAFIMAEIDNTVGDNNICTLVIKWDL